MYVDSGRKLSIEWIQINTINEIIQDTAFIVIQITKVNGEFLHGKKIDKQEKCIVVEPVYVEKSWR